MKRDDIRTQFPDATDEQINALLNIHSADIGRARGDTEALNRKVADLEAQLSTTQAELTEAKKNAGDLSALNEQITKLTADVSDRDAKLASMSRDYSIRDALRTARARDVDIVFGLLDRSKIATDKKGNLTGVEEQVKALRESKGFLFEQDEKPPRGGFGGKQDIIEPGGATTNAAMNNVIRAMAGRQ